MKNTSVLCILTIVAALLLNACHKAEGIAENIGDPTYLSGVWRLEKREYPGGSTYYSDLENDPWYMRLYEGDSVFYDYRQKNDTSGTVIVPYGRSYFTVYLTADSTLAYYEGEDPHPLVRAGDSVMVIQSSGIQYTWVRQPLNEELRQTFLNYADDAREHYIVISMAERSLKRKNYLLVSVLFVVFVLLAAVVAYTLRIYKRKRYIERQLLAIREETQLRPAIVHDAMQRVAEEFKRSPYYIGLRRRLRDGEVLSEADWREMEQQLKTVYPDFVRHLSSLYRLSEVEWRICLLIRLELSPSDMTKALCREASSISSIRSRLYAKVFGRKGSPRDWDEFILSL